MTEGANPVLELNKNLEDFEDEDTPYPTSDGRPMGETDLHRDLIMDLIHCLELHYQDQSEVYVSGNILMFYEEGNRRRHLSPDVLVVLGRPKTRRENYKVWEEGKPPDLVIEVTSASTRSEDFGEKRGLYAMIGVRELVLFDPREEYLKPRLRLYRLRGEDYLPVVNPSFLESVGLELLVQNETLRLKDPKTGLLLETRADTVAEKNAQKQRADAEKARADFLQAELDRLKDL